VGRVDRGQKGIQLIIEALTQGFIKDVGFVFLGTGDPELEQQLHQAAQDLDFCKIFTEYNEPLAAQIYAASDLVIIPSKYEPCGLVQMIAMRYGSLPIARKTGGLADTIIHDQDGFLFEEYSTSSFIKSIEHAISVISQSEKKQSMVTAAMSKDFSWNKPALEYQHLYQQLLDSQNTH